jgi:hypothetical protein
MARPIRISSSLLEDAEIQGALEHRSAPKQVEYWASIGKLVSAKMTPEDSLALLQGFLNVNLVASNPADFDIDDIMAEVESDRATGTLANKVSDSPFRYGIDPNNPSQLIRMDSKGIHNVDQGI